MARDVSISGLQIRARSWLARLFSPKKRAKNVDDAALDALLDGENLDEVAALYNEAEAKPKAARSASSKQDDDLRRIVDEALDELHAGEANPDARAAAE